MPGSPLSHPVAPARVSLPGFLCGVALTAAVAIFLIAGSVRVELAAERENARALAIEQALTANDAAALIPGIVSGGATGPDTRGRLAALHERALAILVHVEGHPGNDETAAAWTRLAVGLDQVRAAWLEVSALAGTVGELRDEARLLRDESARIAGDIERAAGGWERIPDDAPPALPALVERFRVTAARFAGMLEPTAFTGSTALSRAEGGYALYSDSFEQLREAAQQTDIVPQAVLVSLAERLTRFRSRMDRIEEATNALGSVFAPLAPFAEPQAALGWLAPQHPELAVTGAATGGGPHTLFIARIDAWFYGSGAVALVALFALVWLGRVRVRRQAMELDRRWSHAAAANRRARRLVHDFVIAVQQLEPSGTKGAPAGTTPMSSSSEDEMLEADVWGAIAGLPHAVARRAQRVAELLPLRGSLRGDIEAARHAGAPPDSLAEVESAFRRTGCFGAAALAAELRLRAPGVPAEIAAEGFAMLEYNLQRVVTGDGEEHRPLIVLVNDFRALRGATLLSASLGLRPEVALSASSAPDAGAGARKQRRAPAHRADEVVQVLDRMRRTLETGAAWVSANREATEAATRETAKLVREFIGDGIATAAAAEGGKGGTASSPPDFWRVAAAFSAAVEDGALTAGPAVRRVLAGLSPELGKLTQGANAAPHPARLVRELSLYTALAGAEHPASAPVRTALGLDRVALAVPEFPDEAEREATGEASRNDAPDEGTDELPDEIIQQLEGIRATLERINEPGASG